MTVISSLSPSTASLLSLKSQFTTNAGTAIASAIGGNGSNQTDTLSFIVSTLESISVVKQQSEDSDPLKSFIENNVIDNKKLLADLAAITALSTVSPSSLESSSGIYTYGYEKALLLNQSGKGNPLIDGLLA